MNNIFISYKVHNRKIAIEYYKELKALGFNPWFDQLIPLNTNWKESIEYHIKKADVFLCLLSKETLLDDWVYNQIAIATKNNKEIIYLKLDDTPDKEFNIFEATNIYTDFNEINIEQFFTKEHKIEKFEDDQRKIKRRLNHPFITMCILAFITIYIFCFGLKIFNLKIDRLHGFIFLAVTVTIALSYIPKRIGFIISSAVALLGLFLTVHYIKPAYISGFSVTPLIYILFLLLFGIFRYSHRNIFINIFLAIIISAFVTFLLAEIMYLGIYYYNFDAFVIYYVVVVLFLVIEFFCYKSHYYLIDKYESV